MIPWHLHGAEWKLFHFTLDHKLFCQRFLAHLQVQAFIIKQVDFGGQAFDFFITLVAYRLQFGNTAIVVDNLCANTAHLLFRLFTIEVLAPEQFTAPELVQFLQVVAYLTEDGIALTQFLELVKLFTDFVFLVFQFIQTIVGRINLLINFFLLF